MAAVADPASGLKFYELSHEWGHGVPVLPGHPDVMMYRSSPHAKNGVLAHRIRMVMHSGTHLNAPRHLIQKAAAVGEIPIEQLFGPGVVLSIPKGKWELVQVKDLEDARPAIEPGDLVAICTGWHRHYSDSQEYYGHSPGLSKEAASWLVAKGISLLAMDTPQIDHPLATSLGPHRNGPQMPRLAREYQSQTGRKALADFPEWNPAHRTLLAAGIPTVENAGADILAIAGRRCTLQALPWKWPEGDACPIRFVAISDESGNFRIDSGASA